MAKILEDNVFTIVRKATDAIKKYGKDKVINATVGALFAEDGKMVALDSVWNVYNNIPNVEKASYACDLQGNPTFREACKKWLNLDEAEVVATPGGSGAISVTLKNSLQDGDSIIYPDVCWGPYKIMAVEYNLKSEQYQMFEGDSFNIRSFKEKTTAVMEKQGKITVIINDPAHNPTGYSMSLNEWEMVMEHLNTIATQGKITLINDIAYIDYCKDSKKAKKHFELFKTIDDNITVVVAFSLSKSLTAYGLRVGATLILGKDKEEYKNLFSHSARAVWSNINNGGQNLFAKIIESDYLRNNYLEEKGKYVKLLKERSEIFLLKAKEVELDIYPHREGFFVTVKIVGEDKDLVHQKLMDKLIFTINLKTGLRIALCSLNLESIEKLPYIIKKTIKEVQNS